MKFLRLGSSLLFLTLCGAAAAAPDGLDEQLQQLARRAEPGTFGVWVTDLNSGAEWRVNADRAYPMMSVFKAPVAAAVLARVDEGTLSLQQKISVTRDDFQAGSAVPSLGDRFKGERMDFTLEDLLKASVSESDNTSVDVLIRVLGGADKVTSYLRSKGVEDMRIDHDEKSIDHEVEGLAAGASAPPGESDASVLARERRGYMVFLKDPRNTTTPAAATAFLRKLWNGELLSKASTRHLLELMYAQTTPNRMRQGLASGVRLADKCGTAGTVDGRTSAYNDIGIFVGPDGHVVTVAAFLTDSRMDKAGRDALYKELGEAISAVASERPAVAHRK